jgi:hypothetical protein
MIELSFDLIDHHLDILTSDGEMRGLELRPGVSVADFYAKVMHDLHDAGVDVSIRAVPYEGPSDIPFALDSKHAAYDGESVHRFWQALRTLDRYLQEFRGRFVGKSTPVHLFWHSFDLALTRFSGREAPPMPEANRVTREAYSHEVVSFGFWPGDETTPFPALYSYTAPEPGGLTAAALKPATAAWTPMPSGSNLALLRYDDLRAAADPRAMALDFLESAYQAGARAAGWDVERLTYHPAR